MTISRMFYIFALLVVFIFTFSFIDAIFGLGIANDAAFETFLAPFVMCTAAVIAIPYLRKNFASNFILDKKQMHQSICFPILIAIAMGFIINIYRFIPYWLGSEPIGVGSNQVTNLEGLTDLGLLLLISVIGPFTEEFIFRFLLYTGVVYLLTKKQSNYGWLGKLNNSLLVNKNPIYVLGLVFLVNFAFSMVHGPNLLNFPTYFLGGVVDTLFFIRYGFLSAWISHGVFNLFSGITLSIVTQTML